MDTARSTLAESDLCRDLGVDAIDALLSVAALRHYDPGQQLLFQGQQADAVFLPCHGELIVERSSETGQRQVLGFLQRGDLLGFSTSLHLLYSAHALTPTTALRFPAKEFLALGEQWPTLRENTAAIGNQVLARVLDHLFALGQKRAHARVAFLLWQRWQRGDASDLCVHLSMRRGDIADYLGLTLETTSRAFSRLRREGVINTEQHQHVQILDETALRSLAAVGT